MAASPYPFLRFQQGVNWRKVNSTLLSKLNQLGRARRQVITVTSGWRSVEHQARLYQRYVDSGFDIRYIAAPPGRSNHNHGEAVDATIDGVAVAVAVGSAWLKRFGLAAPVKGDPVHVELAGARSRGGNAQEEDDSGHTAEPVADPAAEAAAGEPRPALDLGVRPTPVAPMSAAARVADLPGSGAAALGVESLPETWRLISSLPLSSPESRRFLELAELSSGVEGGA